jgi:hypothetical protein
MVKDRCDLTRRTMYEDSMHTLHWHGIPGWQLAVLLVLLTKMFCGII